LNSQRNPCSACSAVSALNVVSLRSGRTSTFSRPGAVPGDAMLRDLPVQRLSIQTEHPGGGGLVAVDGAQRAQNMFPFDVGEPPAGGAAPIRRRLISEPVGQILRVDH